MGLLGEDGGEFGGVGGVKCHVGQRDVVLEELLLE